MPTMSKTSSESVSPRPWVLIVDDDADNRELLAEFLEYAGYPSCTCGTGKEAHAVLDERDPPCLVIADIHMADVDGRAFVEQLRRREGMAELPVVFVTGVDAARLGPMREAVLTKPVDLDVLVKLVSHHCDASGHCDAGGANAQQSS